jgi:hypothetical protein
LSNLTSSKSNLALSVSALCLAVQVSAAVLHLSCNPPSNGNERVADRPKLFAKLSFWPVLSNPLIPVVMSLSISAYASKGLEPLLDVVIKGVRLNVGP